MLWKPGNAKLLPWGFCNEDLHSRRVLGQVLLGAYADGPQDLTRLHLVALWCWRQQVASRASASQGRRNRGRQPALNCLGLEVTVALLLTGHWPEPKAQAYQPPGRPRSEGSKGPSDEYSHLCHRAH